ncbi:mannosylglycoprotein endo-beta-mannosidase [Quercus suber]|uniref:Mannosylglycoprotein endo-beta-mannosidase n=1 Tax=Quercus suber TaxID=58331 RepID=A0AAW0JD84_QUESU
MNIKLNWLTTFNLELCWRAGLPVNTLVLIWKAQNPWTGLSGQLNDPLLHQTAGFYGCRCAAESIHVLLNLATYFIEEILLVASIWWRLQAAGAIQNEKNNYQDLHPRLITAKF